MEFYEDDVVFIVEYDVYKGSKYIRHIKGKIFQEIHNLLDSLVDNKNVLFLSFEYDICQARIQSPPSYLPAIIEKN